MKLQTTDLFKVLTIDKEGETKTGDTYVQCSALLFADDSEQYVRLVAFGHNAEYILDNHDGEHMRRAMVTGAMEIDMRKVVVTKKVKGVTKQVYSHELTLNLIATSIRFIDKKNGIDEDIVDEDGVEEDSVEDEEVEDGAEIEIEAEVVEETKPTRGRRSSTKTKDNKEVVGRPVRQKA